MARYWVVSGGIRWFQLVLDRFRLFLVLVITERLNVGIDLMWSILCKTFTSYWLLSATCLPYLFWISSNLFSVFPWLNFEYWIACQLSWFRCKSATVYILHNFPNVLVDWYFSIFYLSFYDFFPVHFSPWPKKKKPGKKPAKNFPPNSL